MHRTRRIAIGTTMAGLGLVVGSAGPLVADDGNADGGFYGAPQWTTSAFPRTQRLPVPVVPPPMWPRGAGGQPAPGYSFPRGPAMTGAAPYSPDPYGVPGGLGR